MFGGMAQDGSSLAHFHEEGRFPAHDVVSGAETSEDPVHRRQTAFRRRNTASQLSQDDEGGGLRGEKDGCKRCHEKSTL